MPFTPRSFDTREAFLAEARNLSRTNEANAPDLTLRDIGDRTATIGYGYTFARRDDRGRWSRYGNLPADLADIGHALTAAQETLLDNFIEALNPPVEDGERPASAILADLSASFGAITAANAEQLFELDFARAQETISNRLRALLGETAGTALIARVISGFLGHPRNFLSKTSHATFHLDPRRDWPRKHRSRAPRRIVGYFLRRKMRSLCTYPSAAAGMHATGVIS